MYANVQMLDAKAHQNLRFTAAKDYAFARPLRQAPLALAEVLPASLCYPVLFSPEAPSTALTTLAILGRESNHFVDDQNRWTAAYVPVHVQRYPFVLGRAANSSDYVVMADLDAPHFASTQGISLFNEAAELSEGIQPVVKLMLEFEIGRDASLLKSIEDAGILVGRELYKSVDGQKQLLGSYRIVDKAKLAALDDAVLATWVRNGLMRLIDAHILSLQHLDVMLKQQ